MKRVFLIIICLSSLILINAQTASDYCHAIANHYIQGEKKAAKSVLAEAIQKYPNDSKLKNLADKVNKLPDEDNKKNQQDQNQQDQKKQDQKQDDKNNQDQKKSQQPKNQMSKENAQQILDALQQDEKNTQDKAKKQQVRGTKKAEKDW